MVEEGITTSQKLNPRKNTTTISAQPNDIKIASESTPIKKDQDFKNEEYLVSDKAEQDKVIQEIVKQAEVKLFARQSVGKGAKDDTIVVKPTPSESKGYQRSQLPEIGPSLPKPSKLPSIATSDQESRPKPSLADEPDIPSDIQKHKGSPIVKADQNKTDELKDQDKEKKDPEKVKPAKACVILKKINFNENEIFKHTDQQRITAKYLGQCLKAETIKKLLNEVNQFYLSGGYVTTKAFLTNQDISDGEIELKVMKGVIEDIYFEDKTISPWRVLTAFAFQIGNVLNLRDLENALENINRLPSCNAKFSLVPGSSHGLTNVVIANQTVTPFRFSFGFSGGKTPHYIEPTLNLSLQFDNLFNLNDTIGVSANGSELLEEYQGSSGYELNYSFPVGSTLLDFTYSKTSYQQEVVGINNTYLSEGETTGHKIQLNKKLARNKSNKLELKLSVNHKNSENYFEKELVEVSSYKTTVARVDLNHTYLFPSGQLNSGVSMSVGTDWFGANSDAGFNSEEDDVDFRPRFEFTKLVLNTNLVYYLTRTDTPWTIDTSFKCQLSQDILHSSEKISVGNDYSVRGYSSRYFSGNNGWYLKTDMKKTQKLNVSPLFLSSLIWYVGADLGEVICQPDTAETCGGLTGMAIGVNTIGSMMTSSLFLGKPLTAIGDDFDDTPIVKYSFQVSF